MHRPLLAILFSLFIGILQPSYSQSTFDAGYVVTLEGDTIKGFIGSNNKVISPVIIAFKETATASVTSFTPLTAKGFSVNGNFYESATIQVETSPYKKEELTTDKEVHVATHTIFLEAIVKGSKSLYSYKNEHLNEQFYIKNNDAWELLIFKRYLQSQKDGKSSIVSNTQYVSQLALYLQDYRDIQVKLISTDYVKNDLKNLFITYYEATKKKASFVQKNEKRWMNTLRDALNEKFRL